MRHAINVGLRHVEASHDYPWPPYIPGLFVAGAIIGPQRGGQGRTNYGSHNRSGGTSYGGLSCHKWSPRTNYGSHNWSATGGTNDGRGGPTMAATIGPGRPFMAREIAIAGPPGPTVGGTS